MNTLYTYKTLFLKFILAGILAVCLIFLLHAGDTMNPTHAMNHSQALPTHITVWVHGTRGREIVPVIDLNAKWRQFEHIKCYCPAGLHTADMLDEELYIRALLACLSHADVHMFPAAHTHAFGWSGTWDPAARMQAAHELYACLKQLVQKYTDTYGYCPPLRVITHSHGGNVVLNLATIPGNTITIDMLVLLACPVQEQTAHLIDSPLFGQIISLYSLFDTIQIADPQGVHGIAASIKEGIDKKSFDPLKQSVSKRSKKFFSERQFPRTSKIKQISVKWNSNHTMSVQDLAFLGDEKARKVHTWLQRIDRSQRGLMHSEFLLPTFVCQLPIILQHLNAQKDVSLLTEPFYFTEQ